MLWIFDFRFSILDWRSCRSGNAFGAAAPNRESRIENRKSRAPAPAAAAIALFALFALAGCAGYQLGTGARAPFDTLYIAPVGDSAAIPQAQAIVTTQLRETFLRDGRVMLVNTPEDADAILRVDLTGYDRSSTVARSDDTGLARKFEVKLEAKVSLVDMREKKPLFANRTIVAGRQLFADNNQQIQAEYQLLPLLAETLVDKVRGAALDTW
ncbi:MAG: LPS assembly lipoprotein LptE [Opitutaceae bacterium]|jgi:hypothetical protein|nr:LPS assembly lipoprotein LptE [Opitutaceae bacterium]